MANHPPVDHEHEDGSWFLEAVGAKKRSPSPIESVAELGRENAPAGPPVAPSATPPDVKANDIDVVLTSLSGDPGTSLSSFDPIPDLPPWPPGMSSTSAAAAPVLPDVPSQARGDTTFAPVPSTGWTFRWPVVAAAVTVVAMIALALVWLPSTVDAGATRTRQAYYDASSAVHEFLPTAQASLDVVTKPTSTDAALGTVMPVVSELSILASELGETAAEPLPSAPPLVATDAIEALKPFQDRSAILASDTAEIARQIGDGYLYRTSIAMLLDAGPLPVEASTEDITALSVTLAGSMAHSASLVADLPSNLTFDNIEKDAREAVAAYAQWQEDYLAALTRGDVSTANILIDMIVTTRAELLAKTAGTLLVFRGTIDDRMVSLSDEFDEHLSDLDR